MLEKIIFSTVSFILFVYIFFYKMIKKNDTAYLFILGSQAAGIFINLMQISFNILTGVVFTTISYILCIIFPVIVILVELKGINFTEIMYLVLAKFYMLIGNKKIAKSILVSLLTRYSDSYLGHKWLAEIYEAEGGMRKAIDEYVQAMDLKKDDYKTYFRISQLLKDLNKKNEAIQLLKNLVNKQPANYEASQVLGDLLCEKQRFTEAIDLYMMLLKYYPDNFEIYYNLGIVHTMMNNFEQAKEYYEKAAELNHDFVNAHYRLGQLALMYRDIDQAEESFKSSIYGDTEAASSFELSKIYMLKNQPEKATMFANKAVEIEPEYYGVVQKEPVLKAVKTDVRTPEENDQLEKKVEQVMKPDKEKMVDKHLANTDKLINKINLEEAKEKGININDFRWEKGKEKQRIDPN